jgi:hypothetical protein
VSKALQPNDPRVIELAKHDSLLQRMIDDHLPLDRETTTVWPRQDR